MNILRRFLCIVQIAHFMKPLDHKHHSCFIFQNSFQYLFVSFAIKQKRACIYRRGLNSINVDVDKSLLAKKTNGGNSVMQSKINPTKI